MKLQTFGGLKLEGSDFQRAKSLLLLTYLALEGPKDRSHLAELFWISSDNALTNLNMTLTRLRQADEGLIESNDLRVWTELDIDAASLKEAHHEKAFETILELYQGSFLEGIATRSLGIELEEWLYEKREYYAALVREAILGLAEHKARDKNYQAAAELAAKAYRLRYAPELDEQDLEHLFLLLQSDKHLLTKELRKEALSYGLELELNQEEARGRLSVGRLEPEPKALANNLPIFPTAFVGREQEINSLVERLLQEDTRLLSIIAQGGMGKTRLAGEVARELLKKDTSFTGIYFVSFVSTTSTEQIPFILGEALSYKFLDNRDPERQLLEFLKDKAYLLILDNLEQLLADLSFRRNS